jgi:hypothetical protein
MKDGEPRRVFARIEGRSGYMYAWKYLIPIEGGEWIEGPLSEDPAYERSEKIIQELPINVILTCEDDRWTFRS